MTHHLAQSNSMAVSISTFFTLQVIFRAKKGHKEGGGRAKISSKIYHIDHIISNKAPRVGLKGGAKSYPKSFLLPRQLKRKLVQLNWTLWREVIQLFEVSGYYGLFWSQEGSGARVEKFLPSKYHLIYTIQSSSNQLKPTHSFGEVIFGHYKFFLGPNRAPNWGLEGWGGTF